MVKPIDFFIRFEGDDAKRFIEKINRPNNNPLRKDTLKRAKIIGKKIGIF